MTRRRVQDRNFLRLAIKEIYRAIFDRVCCEWIDSAELEFSQNLRRSRKEANKSKDSDTAVDISIHLSALLDCVSSTKPTDTRHETEEA